jgi:hypothetical protein
MDHFQGLRGSMATLARKVPEVCTSSNSATCRKRIRFSSKAAESGVVIDKPALSIHQLFLVYRQALDA